jgi:ABC-type glycerol-3-phosphate transport system substrate-binding protein
MQNLTLKFAAAALMLGLAALGGPSPAQAEAPKCKPSVGTPNKFVCTTDMTAQPRQQAGVVHRQIKPKFKAKTIPCYQSPVPGCR